MKTVELRNLIGGEIIEKPVYSTTKEMLVPEGTILKKEYIDLLIALGITHVTIKEDENDDSRYLLIATSDYEAYVKRIKKLLESHTYSEKNTLIKTEEIASDIIAKIKGAVENNKEKILIKSHDADLYEHSLSVTLMSIIIAIKLKVSDEKIKNIAEGSILHDLGIRYITVPYTNIDTENIDPAKVFEYKKHTILAYTVLESEKWLTKEARNIILSHHEKMDGSGFPLKQKKQDITCKIVQLADTFDCMITGMECEKKSFEEAMTHIINEKGTKYDEKVVKAFLDIFDWDQNNA